MPPKKKYSGTFKDLAIKIVNELQGPTPVAEVLEKILSCKPGRRSTARNALRQQRGQSFVFLDLQTIIPVHLALQGLRFRINLNEKLNPNFLCAKAFEPFYISFPPSQFQFLDSKGATLPTQLIQYNNEEMSPNEWPEAQGFSVAKWFPQENVQPGDSILVTIERYTPQPLFRLEYEPAAKRQEEAILKQNQELADILFDLLERAVCETLMTQEGVLTAYCRLKNPRGYPGDNWLKVLEQDGRMRYDYFQIAYADDHSIWDMNIFEQTGKHKKTRRKKLPPEQANLVYRFKAYFCHRPTSWRCLELQGKHTLAAFDKCLRGAFNHDDTDHLSGFWKLIPRGETKRFRKTGLAEIDPLGKGEGAELRIADLQLTVGAQLEYIYDFGDSIEHRIILEETLAPNDRVQYPRLADQNKLCNKYCEECHKQNIKTVATLICLECSEEAYRPVLICEGCANAYHEEHIITKILY